MTSAKEWQIAPKISAEAENQLEKYPPVLRQILFNRGISDEQRANQFLGAMPIENDDPLLMSGMPQAVERLAEAILQHENIVVYGDYDADGVCASALLVTCLQSLNAEVTGYIPDRFKEGYGLNIQAIQQIASEGAKLLITVDCGIRSVEEANEAKRLGIDLIITDHHSIGPKLPNAFAIINCKLADDQSENKNLSGAGTAYKLCRALVEHLEQPDRMHEELLDLAALGTVADLVPITGENRWMVRKGVQSMRQPRRQGLMSLMGVAGLKAYQLSASDLGFMLGPRINAAGRLASAMDAYTLLMSTDLFEAGKLAQELDKRNSERRSLTKYVAEAAEDLIRQEGQDANIFMAFDQEFHAGVAGLAASKLVDTYYRPAIVGQIGDRKTRASCRSIPEFNIIEALQECAELFDNFGGHAAAAGFTIDNEKIPELKIRLSEIADQKLLGKTLKPILHADMEISLVELKSELLDYLDLVEPTGYGNRQVNFVTRNLKVTSMRRIGKDKSHLKLALTDGWVTFDAIAFSLGHWAERKPKSVDVLYRFEINHFNGKKILQLNIQDIKNNSN